MQYRRYANVIAVRLDKGDEIVACIKQVALEQKVTFASVSGIGGTDNAVFGVFDENRKEYNRYSVSTTHEICSLVGNVNTMDGEVYTHLHITMAGEGGKVVGGHLLSCVICLTAEIFLQLVDAPVDRSRNSLLGINTWDFDKRNG